METIYRKGKNITVDIKVRLHFPSSATPDQLKWIEEKLRMLIIDDAKILWNKVNR